MNNVNGSKKNGLTVALVVCIAIIIVLGGYIIYDKDVFNLSKNDPKNQLIKMKILPIKYQRIIPM